MQAKSKLGEEPFIPEFSSCTDEAEQFIVAAKENNLKALEKLLSSGVDVNCRHPLGWNALHAAVVNGNWAAIKLLVESGADINAKDEFSSALRIATQEGISNSRGIYCACVEVSIVLSRQ